MSRPNWLDRTLMSGPHLCVCLDEASYNAALDDLNIPAAGRGPWLKAQTSAANATTHVYASPKGGIACVVCIGPWGDKDQVPLYGLLVHEAVHVFQEYCDSIGETRPSQEFEAYSIQWITQQLMWGHAEALKEQQCRLPKAKSRTRSKGGSFITASSQSRSPARLNS